MKVNHFFFSSFLLTLFSLWFFHSVEKNFVNSNSLEPRKFTLRFIVFIFIAIFFSFFSLFVSLYLLHSFRFIFFFNSLVPIPASCSIVLNEIPFCLCFVCRNSNAADVRSSSLFRFLNSIHTKLKRLWPIAIALLRIQNDSESVCSRSFSANIFSWIVVRGERTMHVEKWIKEK